MNRHSGLSTIHVAAAFAQVWVTPDSHIPMVGASGAVSGVLRAYVVLYPRARVLTLVLLGFFVTFIEIPALIVLGFWIVVRWSTGCTRSISRGAGWRGSRTWAGSWPARS